MITSEYRQTDPNWAGHELGFNTDPKYNIGNYGCLVTAYANMLCAITGDPVYTPDFVNNWLKQNNGFAPGGGLMEWSAALGLGHVTAQGEATTYAQTNQFLQPDANFAIIEVRNHNGGQHFVFAPYINLIVDSEDGLLKSMTTYPFVHAHLFTATDTPHAAAVAPPPPAKPMQVTVTARPYLYLRSKPDNNSPVAVGHDEHGNQINKLMPGTPVQYVSAVPGLLNGKPATWLKSVHGNYFYAGGTTYGEGGDKQKRFLGFLG